MENGLWRQQRAGRQLDGLPAGLLCSKGPQPGTPPRGSVFLAGVQPSTTMLMRRSLRLPILLAIVMIALLVVLTVGWVLLSVFGR